MADGLARLLSELNTLGLLSADEGQTLESRHAGSTSEGIIQNILATLVRQGRITEYQASLLNIGRGRDLQLGDYLILDKLGEGGMGTVYKAVHTLLRRTVALKTIRRAGGDPAAIRRFQQEIEALGRLNHPHVVRAAHAAEAGGVWYLVMDFVAGVDLMQVSRRRGPLAACDACEIARQTAIGLQYIHECGLVHRDIKPSNLMLTSEGTVRILDLGLARLERTTAADRRLTSVGEVVGTVDYMAPEQARGDAEVDIRADIYSLGCTLFRLLTGHPPYGAPRYAGKLERLLAHINDPFPAAGEFRPDLPSGLVEVLNRMVRKLPAERYQHPADVAVALAPFCSGAELPRLLDVTEGPSVAVTAPAAAAGMPPSTLPVLTAEPAQAHGAKWPGLRGRRMAHAFVGVLGTCALLMGAYVWLGPFQNERRRDETAAARLPNVLPTPQAVNQSQDSGSLSTNPEGGSAMPTRADRTAGEQQRFEAAVAIVAGLTAPPEQDAPGYEKLSTTLAGIRRAEDLIQVLDQLVAAARQQDGRRRYVESKVLDLGDAFLQRGEADAALRLWSAGLRMEPESAALFERRGGWYLDHQRIDEALRDLSESLRLRPNAPLTLNRRGLAWNAKEEYDRAIADFDEALRLDPQAIGPYNNRGLAWHAKGEYDKALSDFDQHLRLSPDWDAGYVNRAKTWMAKLDYARAIADFTEALRLNPANIGARNDRGLVWRAQGDYDQAITDFDEVIRRAPDWAVGYYNRGLARSDKQEFDNAISDFDQAIRRESKVGNYYKSRGLSWYRKREYDKAIRDFDECLRLNPDDKDGLTNRGAAFYFQKDYDRAIADFSAVLRLDPAQRNALNNRGNAWQAKGEYDKALADLDELLLRNPDDASARSNRGLVWRDKGDHSKALADFEGAMRIDPSQAQPQNALAWLLATCPDAQIRNGTRAVELATRACELTGWKDLNCIDTLAGGIL